MKLSGSLFVNAYKKSLTEAKKPKRKAKRIKKTKEYIEVFENNIWKLKRII